MLHPGADKKGVNRLAKIISDLEQKRAHYTADEVVMAFRNRKLEDTLSVFMGSVIVRLKELGKDRTSETYTATLNSFMRFRGNRDILLEDMD